jgi:hypothetical protein
MISTIGNMNDTYSVMISCPRMDGAADMFAVEVDNVCKTRILFSELSGPGHLNEVITAKAGNHFSV